MTFSDDIKSKHLSNYVLVTIGDPVIHHLSTQKVTLGEDYYKPILLNIPSISESLDVENRKYKISSVRLSISDYEEDGVRFSDSLNQLMNQEVNIYYASPSCKTLEDCYLAGTFIIRSFTQDEDKVGLNCEDLSQDKLHKDLPLYTIGDDEGIPTKYRNKPYPLVFGTVENSPCVITRDTAIENEESELYAGCFDIKYGHPSDYNVSSYNENPLFVLGNENNYSRTLRIVEQNLVNIGNTIGVNQYEEFDSGFSLLFQANTIKRGLLQVKFVGKPTGITVKDNLLWVNHPQTPHSIATSSIHGILTDGFNVIKDNGSYAIYKQDFDNGNLTGHGDRISGFPATWSMTLPSVDAKSDRIYYKLIPNIHFSPISVSYLNVYWAWGVGEGIELPVTNAPYLPLTMMSETENEYEINQTNTDEVDFILNKGGTDFGSATGNTLPFPLTEIKYLQVFNADGDAYGEVEFSDLRINNLDIEIVYDIDNIFDKDFFASVIGRGGSEPSLQEIYQEILGEDILDFVDYNSSLVDIPTLGSYSFTLDKKISSKKLLEEISASSGLFPYFKNGDFNVKSIKKTYSGENKEIKAEDVLSYKYDRTKIEKVYTRVNVKYHYDYGLKDFTKETEFVEQIMGMDYGVNGYNTSYFGEDFDQELEFESKYIRHETTALNLASYLYGLHANQHNLITVKLPLNYLNYELGDIVKFDKLIQGRKIFGEDYTRDALRNGQQIYPYFFITQIKKNLDSVEIKLYQLHNLSNEVATVWGCTDDSATQSSYNEGANADDGSCIYEEDVEGCMIEDSLNYNANANIPGTCFTLLDLISPMITSPDNNTEILLESYTPIVTEQSDNLMPYPILNSTFDGNVAAVSGILYDQINTHPGATAAQNTFSIYPADNLFNIVTGEIDIPPNNSLIDYTLLNVTTGESTTITGNTLYAEYFFILININTNLNIEEGHHWQIISPNPVEAVNLSHWGAAPSTVNLIGGDGTLIMTSNGGGDDTAFIDTNISMYEGETWIVDFKIGSRQGAVTTINVWMGQQQIGEDINISSTVDGYYNAHIDFVILTGSVIPYLQIILGYGSNMYTKVEIDDVFIYKMLDSGGVLETPLLDVSFNPSPNLLNYIDLLPDYVPDGYYQVEILDPDDPTQVFFWQSLIPPVLPYDAEMTIDSIDISQIDIVPHKEYKLVVSVIAFLPNIGQHVFNIQEGDPFPIASDSLSFSWGEVEDATESILGDLNQDYVVNIIDVMALINIILHGYPYWLTQEEIDTIISYGDVTGDGTINILDVMILVYIIMGE